MPPKAQKFGFTLTELLIALGILCVIAAFTIPKVIGASQSANYNARAKEVMNASTAAYHFYVAQNGLSASTDMGDIRPYYLNYAYIKTSGNIDNIPGYSGTFPCAGIQCAYFANRAVVAYNPTSAFGSTASTCAIDMIFDPDGVATNTGSTSNTLGKSLRFVLYADGKIRDTGNVVSGTKL